jgi:hypothetical protein
MIWENMKHFGLMDPCEVIKVGDTAADIEEAQNAGCWSAGVVMGSSQLGLNRQEAAVLAPQALEAEKRRARSAYYRYGADYILNDIDELIAVVDDSNRRLALREPPVLLTPGPLTTRRAVKQAMLADHCTWDDEYRPSPSVSCVTLSACARTTITRRAAAGSGTYAVEAMVNGLTKPQKKSCFSSTANTAAAADDRAEKRPDV